MSGFEHEQHPSSHAGKHRRAASAPLPAELPSPVTTVNHPHRHELTALTNEPIAGVLPLELVESTNPSGSFVGIDFGEAADCDLSPTNNDFSPRSGQLPTPRIESGATGTGSVEKISGVLNIEAAGLPVAQSDRPSREKSPARQRTTVTLKPAVLPRQSNDIPAAVMPPLGSLSTFDLGTVPASVTPPRSWRRAAWFAAVSSSGVVVALLFAGPLLVGKPEIPRAAVSWPGLQGAQPTFEQPQSRSSLETPTKEESGTTPETSSVIRGQSRELNSPQSTEEPPTSPQSSNSVGDPSTPIKPSTLSKPPSTPAAYTAEDPRYFQPPPNSPAALAAKSQNYLDKVTEDPSAAHEMTTGKLQEQSPSALADKYSDVAYYEVKHVDVRQYDGDGVTVCTVKAVRKDGTSTTETHTLTFGENTKIKDDGK